MIDFFTRLIEEQLAGGFITKEQANFLTTFFDVVPPEQKVMLEQVLVSDPRLVALLIDNIGKKMKAVRSEDIDAWREVVADEVRQLDALES